MVLDQLNDFLEETQLVVQCSLQCTHEGDSILFKEWTMSEGYECISVSSVDSSLFVLKIGEGKISVAVPYSEYFVLQNQSTCGTASTSSAKETYRSIQLLSMDKVFAEKWQEVQR